MSLIDISRPVRAALAGWPGDTLYDFRLATRISANSPVNVGSVAMSTHFGTHVDAPFHFQEHGETIDRLPLDVFFGRAVLLDMRGTSSISRELLEGREFHGATRVLLRSDAWLDARVFPAAIPTMEPEVPDWLGDRGVVLVGVDVPSVDPLDSKDLPNHHALARRHIAILESLDLSEVAEGVYELVALPLKLSGSDAAPVRAALRQLT